MVDLKRSQIRAIEEAVAFPQGFGYVLDFSDRTISEFFEDEFGIDFDDPKYAINGGSATEDAYTVAKILRALWDRREGLVRRTGGNVSEAAEEETKRIFLDIIASVEGGSEIPRTDALDRYARDRTLDELISDIERDLQAKKPEAAMDHLHTYCVKKFTHLLRTRGVECTDDEALHARFGKYRKELLKERELNPFTDRALKSAISLFESYNDVRNHHSFAHDNPILEPVGFRWELTASPRKVPIFRRCASFRAIWKTSWHCSTNPD